MKLLERIEVANELGEGVVWDHANAALWWTDIAGCKLYRRAWHTGTLAVYPTPARLASFGLIEGRRDLVAAFENGFALFDPFDGTTSALLHPEGLGEGMRLNDGRVDRQGRFWAGSMVEAVGRPPEARLYKIGPAGIETHLSGLGIGNGLSWSPDGTVCYFADSSAQTIWQFTFDPERGVLSERREFARSAAGACPDGATVDADGFVWCAQWGGGTVNRYAPDGRIDRVLALPVSQPTCVAFGGPGLDHLFVTTAHGGLVAPETGAGDLFVYNAGVRGLEESRFKIDAWPDAAERKE